jgi:hypothetical protein
LSETLSRDRKNVFRPVTGRSKKKTRTSRSRSRRLKPAVRFLETVRQAAGIKNTLRSFETPSPEYQIHRRDIVTLAVGSNDDAAERFDMGRVRHLGGGGARAGRDSRGTRDAPAEHGAGYAGFPALDVRVQRRGHGGLGGLPRKRPDEPHAHRGPVYRRSGDEASARGETRRETNCRRGRGRGARGEARADPAATPRGRARSRGNIARERGRAPRSTRAPRAFAGRAPRCRHLRHIRGDGSHACSTKGARRRRARAARASAREARRGLRRVERSRHEPPRISGGENQPLVAHVLGDLAGAHESSFMPQHANRGVLKHAARGCGSGREGDQR